MGFVNGVVGQRGIVNAGRQWSMSFRTVILGELSSLGRRSIELAKSRKLNNSMLLRAVFRFLQVILYLFPECPAKYHIANSRNAAHIHYDSSRLLGLSALALGFQVT